MATTKAMTPIVAGAQYRDVSSGETHGDMLRVKSVWVDEDKSVQIRIIDEQHDRTVDLDSFIDRLDDEIIRVNSDHEAWKWRQ